MEKIGIGTREIEQIAKKMDQKDGRKKRNRRNVKLILKNRLKEHHVRHIHQLLFSLSSQYVMIER